TPPHTECTDAPHAPPPHTHTLTHNRKRHPVMHGPKYVCQLVSWFRIRLTPLNQHQVRNIIFKPNQYKCASVLTNRHTQAHVPTHTHTHTHTHTDTHTHTHTHTDTLLPLVPQILPV